MRCYCTYFCAVLLVKRIDGGVPCVDSTFCLPQQCIFARVNNLHYEKFQYGTVKCIEDGIPFEVPEGWAWARVRDIAMVKGGKRLPKGTSFSERKTSHAYIRVTDMKNHSINIADLRYISDDIFSTIKNYTIAKDD